MLVEYDERYAVILENFSDIYQSLVLNPTNGSQIETIPIDRSVDRIEIPLFTSPINFQQHSPVYTTFPQGISNFPTTPFQTVPNPDPISTNPITFADHEAPDDDIRDLRELECFDEQCKQMAQVYHGQHDTDTYSRINRVAPSEIIPIFDIMPPNPVSMLPLAGDGIEYPTHVCSSPMPDCLTKDEGQRHCPIKSCELHTIEFPSWKLLQKHCFSAHTEDGYICEEMLASEVEKISRIIPQCNIEFCGRFFSRKDSLLRHRRKVHRSPRSRFNRRLTNTEFEIQMHRS